MLIFVGLIVLCLVGAAIYGTFEEKKSDLKYVGACMGWGAFILLIVCIVAWLSIYPASAGTIGELKAFQDGVFDAYVSAVDMTEQATIKLDMNAALFSAENLKQSSNVSDRIKELRDKLDWYNSTLAKYRLWNSIWWLNPFYRDVPKELKPIKFEFKVK